MDTAFYLVRSQQYDSKNFVFFGGAVSEELAETDVVMRRRLPGEPGSVDQFRVVGISKLNHSDATHRITVERTTRVPDDEVELWISPGAEFVFVSKVIVEG